MSKILLLGGTGAIGTWLAGRMAESGDDVYVTTRSERLSHGRVRYLRGNAQDDGFLADLLNKLKPDAVVDFMSYWAESFAARRDLFLNLTGQYVFTSSCRVFAGSGVHTERSPRLLDVCKNGEYLKTKEYALEKARSEDMLFNSGCRNWTIIRPCITYSFPRLQFGCLEGDTFLPRVQQQLPVPMPREMLSKRTTMLHGGVVAEMIARLIGNSKAMGEDFNTVTAENHSWADIAALYGEFLGMKVANCSLDDYKSFCFKWQVEYGRMVDHVFDNRKVLGATGLSGEDLMTLRRGLEKETRKFQGNSDSLVANVSQIAKIDRVLGTRYRVRGGFRARLRYERVVHPMLDFGLRCFGRVFMSGLKPY